MASVARRVVAFLRRPRIRNTIIILSAYEVWTRASAAATLYKTVSAGSHRVGETVLNLDLGEYEIVPREGGVSILASADQIGVDRLVSAIDAAGTDPRVAALVVRGTSGVSGIGLACLGEIRDAVRRFSSSAWGGKPAILHVPEGIGGVGNGTVPMYFASAFDSVHLQPTSDLLMPGLSFGSYFFKKMLDSLGVSTKVVARKEYKNAANSLTEERFTGPQRESTELLLKSMMSTITAAIAAGRGLKVEEVEAAIDRAFMNAKDAEEMGLVDEACFRDEFPEVVRRKIADARSRRAESRQEIENEWCDAMEGLREVWHTHQREASVWSGTTWMYEISHEPFAGTIALEMCNTLVKEARIAVKAELRALKAHLAWLDSCPWEQYKTFNEKSGSIFYQVPHAFSVLELERRLCVDGIEALERFPNIVQEMLKEAKGGGIEALRKKAVEKKCYRWVRSMARAKTFSARMYDSLQDFVEDEEHRLAEEETQSEEKDSNEHNSTIEPCSHVPRSFLLGDAMTNSTEEEVTEEDETKPAEEEGKRLILAAASKTPRKEQKPHLQYVRLIDYVDLVSREARAASRQSRWGPFGFGESFSFLKDGLVDMDEVKSLLRLRDSQVPFFQTWRMIKSRGAPLVAIIHIDGVIDDASAESVRSAIRRADKDFRIKAIVLRIDSPGGSAVASDIIARAVDVAKKPVVSSMGNMCASGGYYIAAPSDKILCDPGTITGSIGVILQAFNTASLFEKAGVSVDRVDHGRFAKYFGPAGLSLDWDPEFLGCINKQIDKMYETFVGIVAKGRGMNYDTAERIARGRVWAGNDALRLGLVDQYGGLHEAMDIAAELAELSPDSQVRGVQYPSKAMLAEERLRKAGVLPSRIDEEGDEVVPTSPQRKRRWPVFSRRASPEPDDDDEGDDNSATDSVMSSVVGHVADSRLMHYIARYLLTLADDYLMKDHAFAAPSRFIEAALDALYQTTRRNSAVKAIAQQAEVLQATAGRPATVAPEFFIDD